MSLSANLFNYSRFFLPFNKNHVRKSLLKHKNQSNETTGSLSCFLQPRDEIRDIKDKRTD
jgi:hypothetical protein